MLNEVKLALRITTDAFDGEIQDLIDAAKSDLKLSGVLEEKLTGDDILIKRAVITYCKAHFGLDNKDSEKYGRSFDMLKSHLCLSAEYAGGGGEDVQ